MPACTPGRRLVRVRTVQRLMTIGEDVPVRSCPTTSPGVNFTDNAARRMDNITALDGSAAGLFAVSPLRHCSGRTSPLPRHAISRCYHRRTELRWMLAGAQRSWRRPHGGGIGPGRGAVHARSALRRGPKCPRKAVTPDPDVWESRRPRESRDRRSGFKFHTSSNAASAGGLEPAA